MTNSIERFKSTFDSTVKAAIVKGSNPNAFTQERIDRIYTHYATKVYLGNMPTDTALTKAFADLAGANNHHSRDQRKLDI